MVARLEAGAQNPTLLHGSLHESFFFAILLFLPLNFAFVHSGNNTIILLKPTGIEVRHLNFEVTYAD